MEQASSGRAAHQANADVAMIRQIRRAWLLMHVHKTKRLLLVCRALTLSCISTAEGREILDTSRRKEILDAIGIDLVRCVRVCVRVCVHASAYSVSNVWSCRPKKVLCRGLELAPLTSAVSTLICCLCRMTCSSCFFTESQFLSQLHPMPMLLAALLMQALAPLLLTTQF